MNLDSQDQFAQQTKQCLNTLNLVAMDKHVKIGQTDEGMAHRKKSQISKFLPTQIIK